ncbi:YggS family pyridoxal phosphate-dependent enzyme [Ruminococcus sp.]|uniref:YggS family pyridoxal phosphate-dependent enzyme n=1 Tax=Ruminococcus sp. TaxID=41978 RepID=UPI002CD7E594|nr:YggS family pyridoxal phosphate-dependent enzyme [Ruminococcus sp.]HNZ99958.1 YggS family pyridoxal phosphate-dependent enzyme [Ruminococcus sp.]HOH86392.1 YggS family pyridoxal phosphate-dependent enzyme [Ruminococcus sp.]
MTNSNDLAYIDENLRIIRERCAEAKAKYRSPDDNIRIMAVTKTVAPEAINRAVSLGIDLLGENRVQEYLSKAEQYDKSAEVQFIGHLQTNKVKYIINSVSMIQSVDSLKLGQEISRLAVKNGRVMDILCEVNIGGENSKSGVAPAELDQLIEELRELDGIRIRGLMTIPPPSGSDIFLGRMKELYDSVSSRYEGMDTLSMGMTHDYAEAIRYGSTLVRIGTGLFGARDYSK